MYIIPHHFEGKQKVPPYTTESKVFLQGNLEKKIFLTEPRVAFSYFSVAPKLGYKQLSKYFLSKNV